MLRLMLIAFSLFPLLSRADVWKLYDDSQVAEIHISCEPADLEWMVENVQSDSEHVAQVHFLNAWYDEVIDSVGFRLRGNTSRDAHKKSFKLSFNTFVPGRQFHGVDKLNLNGEHNDPAIARSKICWDRFTDLGLTASRAAHAAVFINDVYYGLYISVEHIDDEFLENHFADADGNLWKCLWPADLDYRGSAPEDYHPWVGEDRPYDLKTNRETYDFSELAHLIDLLNNTSATSLEDSLEPLLAVDEVLQYFAMNVMVGGWDDYWFLRNNYYLYHEPGIDRFHLIPYDYDNTFGIDWFAIDWASVNPYSFAINDDAPRPLVTRLLANDRYHDLYTHFLEHVRDEVLDLARWQGQLDALHDRLTPWAVLDTFRTLDYGFSMEDFHDSYESYPYENLHVKRAIPEFIQERRESLNAQLYYLNAAPSIYAFDWWPRHPGPQDSIHIEAAVFSAVGLDSLVIGYHPGNLTVVLSYPMAFNPVPTSTRVQDRDRWTATLPPLGADGHGRFNIAAVDLDGQTNLFPRNLALVPIQVDMPDTVGVCLNEFMASNGSTHADPGGEYDDWLELYNPTASDIYLSGKYLTDDPDDLTRWMFPFGGVVLAAGDFLLVWCDDDEEQTGIHTNFKLDADGEYLALVDTDGTTILDAHEFGPQTRDVSMGRYPDATGNWAFLDSATPGSTNSPPVGIASVPAPHSLSLGQNYPNPFNGSTVLPITLQEPSLVTVNVFDLQGRHCQRMELGILEAGEHRIAWNASDRLSRPLSAGMYLIQVSTPSDSRVIKSIYLR